MNDATMDHTFAVVASIYSTLFDRHLITRREYDDLLRAARMLYQENTLLRDRLEALEKMASSWTGTPERNLPIVQARDILKQRFL